MKKYLHHHVKPYLTNRQFNRSVVISLILLGLSLIVNFYAGQYAAEKASNPVTDIILSNIPTYDVDFIFIYGAFALWILVTGLCLLRPKIIPFTLKSVSLFIIIRAVFVTLTHLGPDPTQAVINPTNAIRYFTFGGDLFFSGHTGLPFLLALIFWENIRLRYFFIGCSIMFGIVVLMGHLHYSIDVLSAFFITYTIYVIATKFFAIDRQIFDQEPIEQD